jgi:hypothetical protein
MMLSFITRCQMGPRRTRVTCSTCRLAVFDDSVVNPRRAFVTVSPTLDISGHTRLFRLGRRFARTLDDEMSPLR